MILEVIHDVDLALVRHTNVHQNGDPVVAVVNGSEVTLKRFRRTNNIVTLIPANDQMQAREFPAARVEIRGVFAGLVRTKVQ